MRTIEALLPYDWSKGPATVEWMTLGRLAMVQNCDRGLSRPSASSEPPLLPRVKSNRSPGHSSGQDE